MNFYHRIIALPFLLFSTYVSAATYTINTGTSAISYDATIYPHQDCEINASDIDQAVTKLDVEKGNASSQGSLTIKCTGFGYYSLKMTDNANLFKSITINNEHLKKSSISDCKNILNDNCRLIGSSDGVKRTIPFIVTLKNSDAEKTHISGGISIDIQTLIDNEL